MNRPITYCLAGCLLAGLGFAATADEPTLRLDRWHIEAGAFLSDFDTTLRLSGPTGGTEIKLEDTLGLDTDDETFRGLLAYRIADRHRLTAGFYSFSRDASARADRSFVIETPERTLEFEAGALLASSFDWDLYPITYRYSFLQGDRLEASIAAGIHWADVDVSIAGEAVVNGERIGRVAEAESSSAPLPVFGLDASYALTDRVRLGGSIQYFGLDFDDISGDLTDVRLTAEYRWTRSFATGLGFTWYDINYNDSRGDFEFDLGYGHDGLEAFLSWRF